MATTLKSSIMIQSSRLLYETSNGAIISEKQILLLAASPFGIPDPLFGLYLSSRFHLSNFRFKILWITVITDGFGRDQWITSMEWFILFYLMELNRVVEHICAQFSLGRNMVNCQSYVKQWTKLMIRVRRWLYCHLTIAYLLGLPCQVECTLKDCILCILRVLYS